MLVGGYVAYAISHIHLLCLYIGKTRDPLIKRPRKHWTTAKAGTEESPFSDMLCETGIHEWTIVPRQFTASAVRVGYFERDRWFWWRKWALNACAPAVPSSSDLTPPAPQHMKQFTFLLRLLHTACADRDYARINFLQRESDGPAKQLNIAAVSNLVVRVPYMDGMQQRCIHAVVGNMVKQKQCPCWERQAL